MHGDFVQDLGLAICHQGLGVMKRLTLYHILILGVGLNIYSCEAQ